MRYPIFALTTLIAVNALAPELAYAGDPEADKRIYEAFQKYIKTVANENKPQEYKKFLEWYPANLYAPTVKKEYEAFVASQATTATNTPQKNNNTSTATDPAEQAGSQGGYGISATNNNNPGSRDSSLSYKNPKDNAPNPFEEAAGAVDGGSESDAAVALDGVALASDPSLPNYIPSTDVPSSFNQPALRRPKSFGIGADFALSALVGPGVSVDYTTLTSRWTVGGALRAPAFQSVQLAFEARRFLTPERPLSIYVGGTLGAVMGNLDAVFGLISSDFGGTEAQSATTFGALAGVQKIRPDKQAFYLELSYQAISSDANDFGTFPGASIGYRYFFK
jgi:hypothetical protein